ncbi:Metallo-dependent hydrolase [Mycena amicta]|nr:Metallo-dependent hydrolase [Mycena amicta]
MSLTISHVRLAASFVDKDEQDGGQVVMSITDGRISAIRPLQEIDDADVKADGIVLPSLCHSHLHLDKCSILDRCNLITGDFSEALKITSQAKAAFQPDELYERGQRLIWDSLECGVTSMRAHVEVDSTVELLCVAAGLKLSNAFRGICDIQVAAFAQEPLFDGPEHSTPGLNYSLLVRALETHDDLKVVGSAPYVEPTISQAKLNIGLILNLALKHHCHVDFHLDYNLDPSSEPLIYNVIEQAKQLSWPAELKIAIGHATRLQLFTSVEWEELVCAMGNLPITLIGLPQSDLYMMGRSDFDAPLGAPRGTLRVPQIAALHNIQVAMSVNNVQNAFTPQGSLDPLALCTLGVALFQSATPQDLRTLLRAVTLTSKEAMAQTDIPKDLVLSVGDPADLVILHGTPDLQSAVLNPAYDRTTIRAGVVVARRRTSRWVAGAK